MEYFEEYYPNADEGAQAQEISRSEFIEIIKCHKERGLDALIEYDTFSIVDNDDPIEILTIRDEYGIFYC